MGLGGTRSVGDILFARHAQRATDLAPLRQIEHLVATGDSAASGLLATSGNRFQLADTAQDFAHGAIADINAAEHHINLSFYAAHPGAPDGPLSEPVFSALERRAAEGLPVTAILDEIGSGLLLDKRASVEFIERLRDNRISTIVRQSSFVRNDLDDARLAVDHRKSLEVDGRVEWHGGMNLVDAWAEWYDVMQRVEGPAAAQAGAVLAARWRDLGGEVTPTRLEVLRRGIQQPVEEALHSTRLLTDGSRNRRELSETFIELTKAVDERFWLMDPYLADQRTMDAIVDVARRLGPDARLFLSPKVQGSGQLQDVFTDPLRRAWAHEFARAGGSVHVQPSFAHAKLWLMNDVAGAGSHNKDRSSVIRSYENLMATDDVAAVAQVEGAFHRRTAMGALATQDSVDGWRHLARARRTFGLQY